MIVLFFDRISPGAPNITGSFYWNGYGVNVGVEGAFKLGAKQRYDFKGSEGGGYYPILDTSLQSAEYKNNLTEVRTKGIISKGYIKLF